MNLYRARLTGESAIRRSHHVQIPLTIYHGILDFCYASILLWGAKAQGPELVPLNIILAHEGVRSRPCFSQRGGGAYRGELYTCVPEMLDF